MSKCLVKKRIQAYKVCTEAKLVLYAASIQHGESIAQTCERISPTSHVCSSFLLIGLQAGKYVDVLGIRLHNCQEIHKKYALCIYTCALCTHIRIYVCQHLVHLHSSGPTGVSSRLLGSLAPLWKMSIPSVQCVCFMVCLCAYTHTYTHIQTHPR